MILNSLSRSLVFRDAILDSASFDSATKSDFQATGIDLRNNRGGWCIKWFKKFGTVITPVPIWCIHIYQQYSMNSLRNLRAQRNAKRQETLTAMCVCEYYIRDNVGIPEVAEHSLVGCVGIKSLELTDLHLCDGQACWGRLQLHTKWNRPRSVVGRPVIFQFPFKSSAVFHF